MSTTQWTTCRMLAGATVLALLTGAPVGAQDYEATRRAAEQGDAQAQFELGLMYERGEGVPEDDAEAIRWWRLAGEQGHATAQNNLGLMYDRGEGVPQDFVSAHMWLNLAAATGDEDARELRGEVASRMTPEQVAEAQARAREWGNQ